MIRKETTPTHSATKIAADMAKDGILMMIMMVVVMSMVMAAVERKEPNLPTRKMNLDEV